MNYTELGNSNLVVEKYETLTREFKNKQFTSFKTMNIQDKKKWLEDNKDKYVQAKKAWKDWTDSLE